MKIGALGAVAIAVGLVVGVDGLVLSGALWLVLGVLAWALVGRREREERRKQKTGDPSVDALLAKRDPERGRRYALGLGLLLAIGLGSLAIGLARASASAPASDPWRWLPVAVGAIVAGFCPAVTIPARRAAPSAGGRRAGRRRGSPREGHDRGQAGRPAATSTSSPGSSSTSWSSPTGLPAYRVDEEGDRPLHRARRASGSATGSRPKVRARQTRTGSSIDWDAPLDHADADPAARLERLEDLRRRGLIDGEEYEAQRKRIIGSV